MPWVFLADSCQSTSQPLLQKIEQCGLARPVGKTLAQAGAHRRIIDPMADGDRNESLYPIVSHHRRRRQPFGRRQIFFEQKAPDLRLRRLNRLGELSAITLRQFPKRERIVAIIERRTALIADELGVSRCDAQRHTDSMRKRRRNCCRRMYLTSSGGAIFSLRRK